MALAAAQTALLQLRADHLDPELAHERGDPFVGGTSFRSASGADLRLTFGPDFAEAIKNLAEHIWSGPLASPYGAHVVWIDHQLPAQLRPLATVRNQIVHCSPHEGRERLAAERLALLGPATPR